MIEETRRLSASPAEREHRITQLPILILNAHSRCNCRCVMCDIWRSKERKEIGAAEVSAWLPELRRLGVRHVALTGGEALLNRGLKHVCTALREAGIRTTLLSTGLLLASNAEWLAREVDEVIVSLDGPEAVHDRIRGVTGAFRRMQDGIASLKRWRAALRITGRCVVQKANHGCLAMTVRAAREIGLDGISFLAADVSSLAFNRPSGWPAERADSIALRPEEIDTLEAEIARMESEMAAEFSSGFIAESPSKLRSRILRYYRALGGDGDFAPMNCAAPWVSCVVEADGDVRPCFFHAAVGNVREDGGLGSVLNSPRAIAFRRELDVRTNPTCIRCVCSLSHPDQALRSRDNEPAGEH